MDERTLLMILGIVAVVAIVSVFGSYMLSGRTYSFGGTDALTGNVVVESETPVAGCDACTGYDPVCAKVNNRFVTYATRCEAECASLTIVFDGPCNRIPTN